MKARRKTKFTDEKTEGNKLSKKRNQGTQRLLQQIKDHQFITGFKVKVQFPHTWSRGKSYKWTSSNWSNTTENVEAEDLITVDEKESESDVLASEMGGDSDSEIPDSQDLSRKPKAQAGSSQHKDIMRKPKCAKCFQTKNSSLDPHPSGLWLHCGYDKCRKLTTHAACSSVNLPPSLPEAGVRKFCKEFIRCHEHFGKHAPSFFTGLDSGDEDPFETNGGNISEDSDFSTHMASVPKASSSKASGSSDTKLTAPNSPKSSTPKVSAPKTSAPKLAAPKASVSKPSAPKSSAPKPAAPKASSSKASGSKVSNKTKIDGETDSIPKLNPRATKIKAVTKKKKSDKTKQFNVSDNEDQSEGIPEDDADFQIQFKIMKKSKSAFHIGDEEFD